ncbi:MAG: EMC3/TMCO1 family protein [Thaumarchaeota archaeon]|jgi:uncharacterized membrane protein (DUF106 family)|nr:EMC3/TMCO1 family protein [Nitrososphaerota archaeon]
MSLGIGIPETTLIVTLTAIGLGFASNIATRLLVDLKKEKRLRAETSAFDKELRQAIQKKDKAKEDKLKKLKPQMDQMKLKASTGRFKVLIVTWVPFILVYYFMAGELGGLSTVVAHSPLPIPFIVSGTGTMVLIWWYFLSSLTFGTLLSKLLGTSPT